MIALTRCDHSSREESKYSEHLRVHLKLSDHSFVAELRVQDEPVIKGEDHYWIDKGPNDTELQSTR